MRTDGVDELVAFGERLAECASQRGGFPSVQLVRTPAERNDDCVAALSNRYLIAGEFLDQERGDSVTYTFVCRSSHKILSEKRVVSPTNSARENSNERHGRTKRYSRF
jgi:hypothetical protein